ncbi:MAG: cytochrome c biogenesis protein CcmG/thiol:disulfide interchange protein DsbE [Candidatus Endobugula sp.]|jgi:cytochrome c biogenesis protein CcmG/thiol:disulfide interchange protein DsbE
MNQRVKLFIPLAIFMVLVLFFWRGLSLDPNAMPSALIGKPFPVFSLISLQNDQPVYRDNLLDEVSLVNIWATWCAACKYEHPVLNGLASEGIRIIGINYKDNNVAAKKWLDELGNPYAFNIVDSDGVLGVNLGVFGAPETYLVDKKGIIRYKHVGIVDRQIWNDILKPLYTEYSK